MVLVLFGITLIAATMLGLVYDVTKGPIEAAKAAKTTGALAQVMPEFDNDPAADTVTQEIDGLPVTVYKGTKGNAVTGYAIETMTKNGFSGEIKMMVGFNPKGEILNIEVLQHNETPGLGSKMADPDNVLLVSFQGKNPKDLKMSVRKDGGDIDVITASTISSRAYVDAVERAYKAFQVVALGEEIEQKEPVDYLAAVLPEKKDLKEPRVVSVEEVEAKVIESYDKTGAVGYAVEIYTEKGIKNRLIRLMVGFTVDGRINDVAVMEQRETKGYGAVIEDPDNVILASIKGKKIGDIVWAFKEDGGTVDAISGSTVTSNAYMEAVKNACTAYLSYIKTQGNE